MEPAEELSEGKRRLPGGFGAVSSLTLLSRITGLLRDAVMASVFGAGWILDAFTVAFRVPNLARRLLGDGAMAAALLPALIREREAGGRTAAAQLLRLVARRVTKWLIIVVAGLELLAVAVRFLYPLSHAELLFVDLSLILLPYMVLVCLAAVLAAGLNSDDRFALAASLPVLLNVIWCSAAVSSVWWIHDSGLRIRAVALSVIGAGLLQVFLVYRGVRAAGLWDLDSAKTDSAGLRMKAVFTTLLPALAGLTVTQINNLADGLAAWGLSASGPLAEWVAGTAWQLPDGSASALYLGQRLFQFPLGVFGVALGTVLFPRMTRHVTAGDRTAFGQDVAYGMKLVLLIGIPASAGLFLLSEPLAQVMFHYGEFTESDVRLTSQMIGMYGLGVWIFCGLLILNRSFYAAGDTGTPVRQGLLCVVCNLPAGLILLHQMGPAGLAAATVFSSFVQLAAAGRVAWLRSEGPAGYQLWPDLLRSISATGLMSVFVWWGGSWFRQNNGTDRFAALGQILVLIPAAVVIYFVVMRLMGVQPSVVLSPPKSQSD